MALDLRLVIVRAAAVRMAGLLGLLAASASGCASRVPAPAIGGTETAYADSVPSDVYTYPHGWYAGGYAYFVRGSWYYPSAEGWLRFQREPDELRARREALSRGSASAPTLSPTSRAGSPGAR